MWNGTRLIQQNFCPSGVITSVWLHLNRSKKDQRDLWLVYSMQNVRLPSTPAFHRTCRSPIDRHQCWDWPSETLFERRDWVIFDRGGSTQVVHNDGVYSTIARGTISALHARNGFLRVVSPKCEAARVLWWSEVLAGHCLAGFTAFPAVGFAYNDDCATGFMADLIWKPK